MRSNYDPDYIAPVIVLVGAILLLIGLSMGQHVKTSEGHRDGVVQKFSHRGAIWPTWEGELALEGGKFRVANGDGSGGNLFMFTVADDATAVREEIEQLGQERVRLHYRQQLTSLPWNGDTTYRITRVERLK